MYCILMTSQIWLAVGALYKKDYFTFTFVCPFDHMVIAGSEKARPVNQLNAPIW